MGAVEFDSHESLNTGGKVAKLMLDFSITVANPRHFFSDFVSVSCALG